MKENSKDELLELLTNEDFKKWVMEPTHERDIFWKKWLENNPEKEIEVQRAIEFIRSAQYRKLRFTPEIKDEILSNIILQSPPKDRFSTPKDISKKKNPQPYFRLFKAAAAVVIIAAFIGLFWKNQQESKPLVVEELTFVKKENPDGRKSFLKLPDGTKVTLNSSSVLTYDSKYGEEERIVRLMGEAFFEVIPNIQKPFSVISDNIVTTALGTSFNVKAFEGDNSLKISLMSGKVKIVNRLTGQPSQENILSPGEGLVIEKESGDMAKVQVDPLTEYGWKDGILVFKDDNLVEVVEALERWYGVSIEVVGQPEKQWRVDGTFDNETLEQVLQGLSFTYDVDYLISGKNVQLKFK